MEEKNGKASRREIKWYVKNDYAFIALINQILEKPAHLSFHLPCHNELQLGTKPLLLRRGFMC